MIMKDPTISEHQPAHFPRDPKAYKWKALATVASANPGRVAVVAVRNGAVAEASALPEGIGKLGSAADDPTNHLAGNYGITDLPAIVVLKSRPMYHVTLPGAIAADDLEAWVDGVLGGADLVPQLSGGCGGGCSPGACGTGMMPSRSPSPAETMAEEEGAAL